MKIAYVIPKITHGGGITNILEEVKAIKLNGAFLNATLIALEPGTSPSLIKEAMMIGLRVVISPSPELMNKIIIPCDLLVVHYWNSPSMYLFYKHLQSSQIKCRICINLKVNGCTLPQVVPNWIYATAEAFIYSNPLTPTHVLPSNAQALLIPSLVKLPENFNKPRERPFTTFKLVHAGTLNAFKMHPKFMELHAGLNIKDYTLDIWGSGADDDFIIGVKKYKNYNFNGFSSQLSNEIKSHHLLCNPQISLSYASYDKIMLESQWLGIPVIVLKNSFISTHIKHNINGIVAKDVFDYKQQIEYIASNPDVYNLLAQSTYEYAHDNYKLSEYVKQTVELYEQTILNLPKVINENSMPVDPFNAVMDGMGKWRDTMINNPEKLTEEEMYFALRCEGGLIHFYNKFPDNTLLKNTIMKWMNLLEE
jgi:hypothetical protein